MSTDNKKHPNNEYVKENHRTRFFLALVFLLFVVSCSFAGYLLGSKSNLNNTGNLIDTIVVGDNELFQEKTLVSLSGRVVFANGKAFSKGIIRLGGTSIQVVTDANGNFLIQGLKLGSYEVLAIDQGGKIIGRVSFTVSSAGGFGNNKESQNLFEFTNGDYYITVRGLVVSLNLDLTINPNNGKIELKLDNRLQGGGNLTPGAVIPEGGAGNLNNNGNVPVDGGGTPTDSGITPGDGQSTGGAINPTESAITTEGGINPTGGAITTEGGIDGGGSGGGGNTGGNTGDGSVTPPNTVIGPVQVYEGETVETAKEISKLAFVNLFGKGVDPTKIHPGSLGSYKFKIKNPNAFALDFVLTIEETVGHEAGKIPLEYRLKNSSNSYVSGGGSDTWLTPESLKSGAVVFPASSEAVYTLEWRWPFDGNDAADTLLGIKNTNSHVIAIKFHFEER